MVKRKDSKKAVNPPAKTRAGQPKQNAKPRENAAKKACAGAGAGKRSVQGEAAQPAPLHNKISRSAAPHTQTTVQARTASGKIPQGRTLSTQDKYLDKNAEDPEKERPVVVIEANEENQLAVVQLTSRDGNDRTRLKNYQQGQSRFKHYVEIEDSDGEPIKVNNKFKENHPNMDVAEKDIRFIKDIVFNHSKPMQKNRQNIEKFRNNKKSPRD